MLGAALAAPAYAALPGHVVGKPGSAAGDFAIATTSATVKHPHAIYGRLLGRIDTGTFILSCSRGFNVSARSIDRNHAGLFRAPDHPHADSCLVTASAGGSGSSPGRASRQLESGATVGVYIYVIIVVALLVLPSLVFVLVNQRGGRPPGRSRRAPTPCPAWSCRRTLGRR